MLLNAKKSSENRMVKLNVPSFTTNVKNTRSKNTFLKIIKQKNIQKKIFTKKQVWNIVIYAKSCAWQYISYNEINGFCNFENFCNWYVPALAEMEWTWFEIKTTNESKLYCDRIKSLKKKFRKLSTNRNVRIPSRKG